MRGLFALLLCCLVSVADAQTIVHFSSLDGPVPTELDGYLFAAPGSDAHPAVVFLHGCSGMFSRSGSIYSRELDWANRLNGAGITVLMVDSLGPRHHGEMCAPAHFDPNIYRARPFDAYAALDYLQRLPGVKTDRIGVIGWSQGGGTVLNSIRSTSPARPRTLPQGNFRAAVSLYPSSCNVSAQGASWSSPVPLLLLVGAKDVWNPLDKCEKLMSSVTLDTTVTMHIYPNAYHDFDWPNMPVHNVPGFTTKAGIVPIEGTDPDAKSDAQQRVTAFLTNYLFIR